MANLLYQQIEMLSREKHIEPEVVVSAIEDAMVVAARKFYKSEEDLRGKFNPETGQVDVFSVHTVVEEVTDPKKEITLTEAKKKNPSAEVGTEIITPKPTDVLGRIAAQTAKQVILQKVREAERDTIFNEYNGRVGELVTVIVKRAEGPDLIVDMGRTEARLPKREQSKLETYNIGERLRVVIKAVDRAAKGPQVIASRADASLVQRLFEMEVPEIYDGTVQIRHAAREAGERTKVAVDRGLRPKGAEPGESDARADHRSGEQEIGSDRGGFAAFAGDRQERAKRPTGEQADWLGHRYQERRREAPGNRRADDRTDRAGNAADVIGGHWCKDHREDGGCRSEFCGEAGFHDAGAIDGNSGNRRKDGGQDLPGREPLL